MTFFDSLIKETLQCLGGIGSLSYKPDASWPDVGRNELVMQRDAAYELNGVGFNLVTSEDIGDSEIVVMGCDIKDITSDQKFARISIIRMNDKDDEQKCYDAIRKIEYAKYHYFPKGYMIRTASDTHNEVVRVSKSAITDGLSFQKAGSLLAAKYLESADVAAVRIIYVTDKAADYDTLKKIAKRNYDITETLNHVMNNITFDCDACKLKQVCDEVEGMRELHFSMAK